MPFHQPGTGRQKNVNFTQKLLINILVQLPNAKGFFTKITKCQSICHRNYIGNCLFIETISLRFQRDPYVVMLPA